EDLDQIRMCQDVDVARGCQSGKRSEVAAPDLLDRLDRPDTRLQVDCQIVEPVHGAEQQVERILRQGGGELVLPWADVVDLEPELDRQPPALGFDQCIDVHVEVVDATLELVRQRPHRPRLLEVVDVLGEPNLVDAASDCGLDEALHPGHGVVDLLIGVAEVHVVVDDHRLNQRSTSARSSGEVTFRSRGSPSTTLTRPPPASTSDAQSVASRPLATAARRTDATNACGVWTVTSSARGSVSSTAPSRTRLTVSTTGR